MAKSELKKIAQNLRSQGKSIKEIAKIIDVSVGSVSVWCRDITLTPSQIDDLSKRSHDPLYGKRLQYAVRRKHELDQKIKALHLAGIQDVKKLSNRELYLIGTALYWAEGFKKDTQVGFANSDPKMISLFIKWLHVCHNIPQSSIKLRIVINESHRARIDDIYRYWSQLTGFPMTQFLKPTFQKIQWKKQYQNEKEYFGILRIRVAKSTDLLRKIKGSIDGLSLGINNT